MTDTKCPLCHNPDATKGSTNQRGFVTFKCKVCAEFDVNEEFINRSEQLNDVLYQLSAISRIANEQNNKRPEITINNALQLISGRAPVNIAHQARMLLQLCARRTKQLGDIVSIDYMTEYPLVFARGHKEISYLFDYLEEQNWLKKESGHSGFIKPAGWEILESINTADPNNPKVFVAMWFDASMDDAWERAICPAVEETGFKPIRIDKKQHNNLVDNEIIAEIRESRFVIADFTGHRAGVYFEAGYARGLGLEVIHCCRSDDAAKLHFDTNHYNCILWSTLQELRIQLRDRIRATIGLGPRIKEIGGTVDE